MQHTLVTDSSGDIVYAVANSGNYCSVELLFAVCNAYQLCQENHTTDQGLVCASWCMPWGDDNK